jgi:dienelactone hydrolase
MARSIVKSWGFLLTACRHLPLASTMTFSTATSGPSKLSLTAKASPITSDTVSLAGVSFSDVQASSNRVYFGCSDPAKKGQTVVQSLSLQTKDQVQQHSDNAHNVRSAVHEYGGGAFCVGPAAQGGGIIYTDFPSHVVYWKKEGEDAVQIFPAAGTTSPCRLANFFLVESTANTEIAEPFLIAVMEDHTDPAPANVINSIVRLSLDGSGQASVQTLATGRDFYASPCLDADTARLAYVAWDHPNMPWDRTTLYCQLLDPTFSLANAGPMAVHGHDVDGGLISVYAPQWYRGQLYFLSDETGYYNLYAWEGDGGPDNVSNNCQPLYPVVADFSEPKCGWALGCKCFTFLENGTLVAVYTPPKTDSSDTNADEMGIGSRVVLIDIKTGNVREFGRSCLPPTSIDSLTAAVGSNKLYFKGGSTKQPTGLWCWERPGDPTCVATELLSSLASSKDIDLKTLQQSMSEPTAIQFPSDCGVGHAFGYFYPPCKTNLAKDLPTSFLPPLLVKAHGGPTGRTSTTFRLDIAFWNSRGFAILDVDYGGSTGYGKDFQQSLQKNWGIVDVDDVCSGAQYCVEQGWVNPDWLCIDGRSAGGYTTLAALAFRDVFFAGASLYGIGDLSALYDGTHKFESRYMDGLIGSYPEKKSVYEERCPINYTEKLSCPVILLQGDEDKVVPPDQAETMFEVLTAKGLPSALIIYKGEQHGFRKSENIRHALLSEYNFFCETFGIKAQSEENFGGIEIGKRIEV